MATGEWGTILRVDAVNSRGLPCSDGFRKRYYRKRMATRSRTFAIDGLFLEGAGNRHQYLFPLERGIGFHHFGAGDHHCASNNCKADHNHPTAHDCNFNPADYACSNFTASYDDNGPKPISRATQSVAVPLAGASSIPGFLIFVLTGMGLMSAVVVSLIIRTRK